MKIKNNSFLKVGLSILLIFFLLLTFILLYSCTSTAQNTRNSSSKNIGNKKHSEFEIKEKAKEFVIAVLTNDYKKAIELSDLQLKNALSKTKFEDLYQYLKKNYGNFIRVREIKLLKKANYYYAYFDVEHAKFYVIYQVTINDNLEISGFFIINKKSKGKYKNPSYANPDKFKEIKIKIGSLNIDGALTIPENNNQKFPAVILIHGSGVNDMDETIGPNKIFKDIAYGLSSNRIVVLRYNKRVYQFPVLFKNDYTIDELVIDDAVNAYKKILKYDFIDKNKVFLLGHSLGGYLLPAIFFKIKNETGSEPAGLIIMNGLIENIAKLILKQNKFLASVDGKITEEEKENLKFVENKVQKILNNQIDKNFKFLWPYKVWKFFINYDIITTIEKIDKKILILQGGNDIQVFPEDVKKLIKKLKQNEKIKNNIIFDFFPENNHLMQKVKNKFPVSYNNKIEVDFRIIKSIINFISGS